MIKRHPSVPSSIERLRAGLENNCPEWKTIFDIGGGDGTGFLVRAFPGAHHIMYEPNDEFFEEIHMFYKNQSYVIIQKACGDSSGTITINTMDMQGKKLRSIEVECVDILDEIKNCDRQSPYIVKIDTDGDDKKILFRLTDVTDKIDIIIIESRLDEVKDVERHVWFEQHGYELYDITNLMYVDGKLLQTDNIYVKRSILQLMIPVHNYEQEEHIRYVD